jgi:hypothetical protein
MREIRVWLCAASAPAEDLLFGSALILGVLGI